MEHRLWINGEWTNNRDGGRMAIEDPATGHRIAEVLDAGPGDVDRAVQAARTAFYDGRWSKKTPGQCSLALWHLADLLEARTEEFARVESENTGKPYEFGTVWINDHLPLTSETPHGGFKQSGFGKDLSAEAIGDNQITKHVMVAHG